MGYKLGAELRARLREERLRAKARQALSVEAEVAEEAVERLRILLEFTGDLADLTDIGFEAHSFIEHPTEGYKIATGTLPADRIEDLAEIEESRSTSN